MITELICVTGPPSKPAGLCHKHLSFEISRRLPRVVQGSHRKRPLRTFFPTAIITPAQNEINKIAERTRINNCNKPEFCTKYRIMSCWESRHDIGGTLANIPWAVLARFMDLERNRFSAAIRRIMPYLSRLTLQSVRYNNDPLSLIQLRGLFQFVSPTSAQSRYTDSCRRSQKNDLD